MVDGSILREAWKQGRDRWPEVSLALEDFVAHVTTLRSDGDAPNHDDLALHGEAGAAVVEHDARPVCNHT